MGRIRTALRAVPGGFWLAAALVVVGVVGETGAAFVLAWVGVLVGVLQLVRKPGVAAAPAGPGNPDGRGETLSQVLFVLVVGTAVVGGVAWGVLAEVSVGGIIGGVVVLAIVGFLLAVLLSLAIAGVVQLWSRRHR